MTSKQSKETTQEEVLAMPVGGPEMTMQQLLAENPQQKGGLAHSHP